jgi:hypothetical protein
MNEEPGTVNIPTRRDGTPKVFFYDPEHPGHIIYNAGDDNEGYAMLRAICVGH